MGKGLITFDISGKVQKDATAEHNVAHLRLAYNILFDKLEDPLLVLVAGEEGNSSPRSNLNNFWVEKKLKRALTNRSV